MIAIEGNIGSGKTTIGRHLSEKLSLSVYEELANDYTEELLANFYEDMVRWSFTLQVHFLNERFRKIKEITHPNSEGGILDRSIYGDQIFANVLHEDGKMTNAEHDTYSTLLTNMLEHTPNPTLMVYLRCDVDTVYERIQQRGRDFEKDISKEYLSRLDSHYEKWFKEYNLSPKININTSRYNPTVAIETIVDYLSYFNKESA